MMQKGDSKAQTQGLHLSKNTDGSGVPTTLTEKGSPVFPNRSAFLKDEKEALFISQYTTNI